MIMILRMTNEEIDEKIRRIETTAAFQETTIQELNDVVYEQQKTIDALVKEQGKLRDLITNNQATPGQLRSMSEDKPPHY